MNYKTIFSKMSYLISIGISIILLMLVIAFSWIGNEVKSNCRQAKLTYNGDCVEALVKVTGDDNQAVRIRNDAIWALGQLGDVRALPILEKLYTGIIPDREPLDRVISQYELKKAIYQVKGGTNIARWAWKWGID